MGDGQDHYTNFSRHFQIIHIATDNSPYKFFEVSNKFLYSNGQWTDHTNFLRCQSNFCIEQMTNRMYEFLWYQTNIHIILETQAISVKFSLHASQLPGKDPSMPLTRAKVIEAFNHILSNFLKVSKDGPMSQALEKAGYDDIWGLVALSDEDIDSLTFNLSNKEKNIPLGEAHQSLLHIFCHY